MFSPAPTRPTSAMSASRDAVFAISPMAPASRQRTEPHLVLGAGEDGHSADVRQRCHQIDAVADGFAEVEIEQDHLGVERSAGRDHVRRARQLSRPRNGIVCAKRDQQALGNQRVILDDDDPEPGDRRWSAVRHEAACSAWSKFREIDSW